MEQRFGDLIIRLANGISLRRLYFDTHPRVVAAAAEVAAELGALLRDAGLDSFTVGVYGGKFVRDGRYLVGPSIAGRSLIDFAARLGCGGFTLDSTVTPDDLVAFFRLGAEKAEAFAGLAEARAAFARHGLAHVGLAAPLAEEGTDPRLGGIAPEGSDRAAADFAPLVEVYQSMYGAVSANALAVGTGIALDADATRAAAENLAGLAADDALDVMQFLRYPDFDSYTIGHSVRVAALASVLGRALGWPAEILAELATAGLLHDLGKSRIPPEILFKPGRLDDDERRIMESHAELGARVLLDNGERSALVLSAAWGHHRRHDGGGYPAMPEWYRVGIAAELMHVCDVFEALTARRPYKKPHSARRAFEIMLEEAGSYHPRLLALFIETLGIYPPGSEVQLSDRRRAVVVGRGRDLDRPRVRVTHTPLGEALPPDGRQVLDLAAEGNLCVAGFIPHAGDTNPGSRQDD